MEENTRPDFRNPLCLSSPPICAATRPFQCGRPPCGPNSGLRLPLFLLVMSPRLGVALTGGAPAAGLTSSRPDRCGQLVPVTTSGRLDNLARTTGMTLLAHGHNPLFGM